MIRDLIPQFLRRLTDKIFEGTNRARIVLGTDRKDTIESGYGDGGQNKPESGTIDLVTGYSSENPNYSEDKARVYISGMSNPEEYFSVERGPSGDKKSCVISHADAVYMLGREHTKIIAANGQSSIIMDKDGNAEIRVNSNIKLTVGSTVIDIDQSGNISIGSSIGVPKRIITENDICMGIDPVTGAPILSSFLTPGAVIINQNVKIK